MGPVKNTDWWPNMVMLKALTQYQEATGDARVMPFMQRYFAYHLREAGSRPLREWAAVRWGDELVSVIWLFNRTGDPALLKLAQVLHDQGADWKAHFANFEFREKSTPEALGLKPNASVIGSSDARARRQQRDGAQDERPVVADFRRSDRS